MSDDIALNLNTPAASFCMPTAELFLECVQSRNCTSRVLYCTYSQSVTSEVGEAK